uniref:Uncharacterized protein n=1 Tax=Ixodes ricinus TaxID=34613 RepID=A0A090XFC5_IXORI
MSSTENKGDVATQPADEAIAAKEKSAGVRQDGEIAPETVRARVKLTTTTQRRKPKRRTTRVDKKENGESDDKYEEGAGDEEAGDDDDDDAVPDGDD